jgi:hypothetical protein
MDIYESTYSLLAGSLSQHAPLLSVLSSKSDADLIHTEENKLKIVSGSMIIIRDGSMEAPIDGN